MQISILSGIYTDGTPAVRASYPLNYVPVPGSNGVSDGHLRPAEGIVPFATGQGLDRGGITWNGVHYRVSGTSLVSISSTGVVTVLGAIPGADQARLDYSFDRLGIAANGQLRYWNGSTLTLVVDADVGTVNDMVWIDGYFVVTDGTTIAVSDLSDPTSFNPLKYGSSEADPDPIECLGKVQNQLHAGNRNTVEVFENVGGDFFPFSRVKTALITKGPIGRRAACQFADTFAFVGGGRNESACVYMGVNATAIPISTREIDRILATYTEAQLAQIIVEPIVDLGSQLLFIHLPDRTLVYDHTATASSPADRLPEERPVWSVRTTAGAVDTFTQYRARYIVKAYDSWIVGDPQSSAIGKWSATDSSHWGAVVRWEFGIPMLRNEGRGAIINKLELTALTGAVAAGADPMISTSHSFDGKSWSMDSPIRAGKIGDTTKRLAWIKQGRWPNVRIQRFRGDSSAHLTILRLDADIEGLKY